MLKKKKSLCEKCELRGYSKELCKLHKRKMYQDRNKPDEEENVCSVKCLLKHAAIGATLGISGTVAGMAALPILGVKSLFGHLIALKVASAGGAAGMGANVAYKINQESKKDNPTKQKNGKAHLVPRCIGGNDHESTTVGLRDEEEQHTSEKSD